MESEAIGKYKAHFLNEFKKCVAGLTIDEQIHFADTLFMMGTYAYQDPTDLRIFELQEKELLAKYRNRMRYYVLSGFINFLFREAVFFEKICAKIEVDPAELRNDLENGNLFVELSGTLDNVKTLLYILDPKSKSADPDKIEFESDKLIQRATPGLVRKNGITTPRQVLTLYYLFKALGIKMRSDVHISVMTKFMHLVLGWDYSDINNSTLYKLLKLAPKVKENKKSLKEDLHWVKKQFESVNFELAAKMVEEELKGFL